MECPTCQTDLPDDAKFCSLCFTKFDAPASSAQGFTPDPNELAAAGISPPGQDYANIDRSIQKQQTHLAEPVTLSRKIGAVGGGAAVTLAAGYFLGLLPIPFITYLAPFLGGMLAGWLMADDGGRWGLIAVAIPSSLQAVVGVVLASALFGAVSGTASRAPKDMPNMGGLAASIAGVGFVFLAIIIVINCAIGYFGGRAGERVARGPGYGI